MTPDANQVRTYRYLRAGMVLVIVKLYAGILIDRAQRGAFQDSVSDYYATPVRSVFVAALVTVGACMVIIRGYIDTEDIALNLAGLLAPIVAFVPVTGSEGVRNNVFALCAAEALGVAGSAYLIWRARHDPAILPRARARHVAGLVLAAAIVLAAYLWVRVGDASSPQGAHYTAAIALFVLIGIVVSTNAVYLESPDGWPPSRAWLRALGNRYGLIVVAMVVVPLALLIPWKGFGWRYGLFWIETALIVLFALFWIVQTVGVGRAPPPTTRAPGAAAGL